MRSLTIILRNTTRKATPSGNVATEEVTATAEQKKKMVEEVEGEDEITSDNVEEYDQNIKDLKNNGEWRRRRKCRMFMHRRQ